MKTSSMKITGENSDTGRARSASAFETMCVAIIWVSDGISDESRKRALLKTVKQQTGVTSAHFSMEIPLLMMVEYVHEFTLASAVVKAINSQGVRARLVGC